MNKQDQNGLKKMVAKKAASMVNPGITLGIGTGSTVAFLIDALGTRKKEEALPLKTVVTTSRRSKKQLEKYGFKVSPLSEVEQVDLTIDGADRVADNFDGIKGGGGALTLEKNVAINSQKNLWIVDESKLVSQLKDFPLPVEVLPVSCEQNFRRFKAAGLKPKWRLDNDQRFVSHYGNYIIDLAISPLPFPYGLADYLDHLPGVVEHGLFLGICDELIVAHGDGSIEHRVK